jgi:ubiquinone/menaquinone biosynthesis C-methylase UbiE
LYRHILADEPGSRVPTALKFVQTRRQRMAERESGSHYIHGSSAEEQARLAALNDLINQAALREINLRGGERILDVGSGLGQFSRAMARVAGATGRVVGIERDPRQLADAIQRAKADGEEGLVDFRAGDAAALPLRQEEWSTFDVVHARFLLEHVRDPLAIVRTMIRTVRPGGRIVLQDDDHDVLRLWPEPAGFWQLWYAYIRSYDRLGNDPYIGRRLVSLLHEAGATPARTNWLFFGSCSGHAAFMPLVTNLVNILIGARETILSQSLLDRDILDQSLNSLREWGSRPDAAFWYAISWAEGVRKE